MKRIQEYQMLLNASKIRYLEKKKSYLCESNCNSPENVAEIMEKCFQMSNLPEEHVYAIALNTRSSIIGVFEISRGTVAASLLSAREILIRMLIVGATHFLICHNHPSGHLQPSKYDVDSTKNIVNAGRTIGIPLVDHLIIGDGRYVSLLEEYGKELFG